MMVEVSDRKAKLGAKDCRGQFGDEFLGGIGPTAEAVLQIAIEPGSMTGPVRLMPISA
jgi:hypothetical protein